MEPGERCICQHDDWWNAFGEKKHVLNRGDRLTVAGSVRIGGARFLHFKEVEEELYFLETGFVPLRRLN